MYRIALDKLILNRSRKSFEFGTGHELGLQQQGGHPVFEERLDDDLTDTGLVCPSRDSLRLNRHQEAGKGNCGAARVVFRTVAHDLIGHFESIDHGQLLVNKDELVGPLLLLDSFLDHLQGVDPVGCRVAGEAILLEHHLHSHRQVVIVLH